MGRVQSSLVLNDQMSRVLRRINKAMGSVLDSFEAVQRASGNSFNTANIAQARKEFGAADAALNEMEESYRKCNSQQEQLNKRLGQGSTAAGGLLGKIKGIASAYLGMKAVTGLVSLSDTMTQTNARFSMMNDGLQTTAELNDMIYASAQRSRGSYMATADAVAKLGLMAGDAFSSNQETIAFMEQVNKQFKIAGTSAAGIDAAMLQLTQAMGSGVLRGEEYNSILEQAPNIIQAIAKYMGVPKGQLKEMAADGKITADIVKAAMFACADETNAKFESMPKTWSDIWTSMKNRAIKALNPVLTKINQLANSERVQRTVNGLIKAFSVMAVVLASIFDGVCSVYNFVADNWSWLSPIIGGVTAALVAYYTALGIYNGIQAISNGITAAAAFAEQVHAASLAMKTGATFAATAAQYGFNAALLACPLTWIIGLIIAIIAVLYIVIGVINKVANTSISATGVIIGLLAAAGAFIWNLVLGMVELVLGVINYLVSPFVDFANFIGNVFTNPVSSIIYLFQSMADSVLAILQKIASAIDFVFGSNMSDTVQSWRNGLKGKADELVAKYAPNENYQAVMNDLNLSVDGLGLKRIKYKDAWSAGYNTGDSIFDNMLGNFGAGDNGAMGSGIYNSALNDIVANTGDTADNTSKSIEELSYLRDIAERDAINRFTTAEVHVDLGGVTNNVAANTDLDGIISYLTDGVAEALTTASEGVY